MPKSAKIKWERLSQTLGGFRRTYEVEQRKMPTPHLLRPLQQSEHLLLQQPTYPCSDFRPKRRGRIFPSRVITVSGAWNWYPHLLSHGYRERRGPRKNGWASSFQHHWRRNTAKTRRMSIIKLNKFNSTLFNLFSIK